MNGSDAFSDIHIDQTMSQALEQVRELARTIQQATVIEEHVWFRQLLFGILTSALLDYECVETGVQRSIHQAAWGSRNLLELKVITEYVLASAKNATDFRNDLLIDTKEFYEAVTKSHKASHAKLVSMLSEMAELEKGPLKEVLTHRPSE